MKELLALAVLTMPLLAVLCIGGLAGFAGWAAGRQVSGARNKWVTRVAVVVAVVLVFTWDEIAGRLYFVYLCATDSGPKVLKRAQLPAKHWGENGTPKARIVRNGIQFETQIGDRFYIGTDAQKNYSKIFPIDRDILVMRDRLSDDLVSELIVFRYWGGWLVRAVSLDQRAIHCPSTRGFDDFYRESFIKTTER